MLSHPLSGLVMGWRPRRLVVFPLQIFGDRLEFFHDVMALAMRQALADVLMDERFLGRRDGALDCLELLRQIHARTFGYQHLDHAGKMAVRAFEAFDDRRM